MVQVYAERRYRVRSSFRTPVEVDPSVDKILVALHKRPNANAEFLGAVTRLGAIAAEQVLARMAKSGLVGVVGEAKCWLLTSSGSKMAIFAIHRERAKGPRTAFVGGINPWTGEVMRR